MNLFSPALRAGFLDLMTIAAIICGDYTPKQIQALVT
jgi:hypothetical protein